MKTGVQARKLTLLTLLGVAACSGSIGTTPDPSGTAGPNGGPGPTTGGGAGGGGPGPGTGDEPACTPGASFAPARLVLISDDQYRNIVRDVFGVTFPTNVDLTTAPSTSGAFPNNESAEVETTTVQAYQRAADQVAALMTSIPPCATGAVNAACMETYLRKTLPLAWRRPLADDEIAGLLAIFNSAATDGQTRQVQLTMEAALLHPAFLYQTEIGTDAATASGKIKLTPHELASAVSFAVLNSAPDATLWSKALDGTLAEPEVLAAEVTRLLTVPAARDNLMKKVSYYLDFETLPFTQKDAPTYPGFAALQSTLYQSSQMFLKGVMWGGHFNDLFTSRTIYANEAMATAYGLPAVKGAQLAAVTTTDEKYGAGVLTQPALLAASNKSSNGDDIIHRGLWVYYNLLCAPTLPPPPQNALSVAATITGSSREQAFKRDTTCGTGCHGRFDPFGLVTLNYDGIGRFRTTDPTSTPPGGPIDDSATIVAGVLGGSEMPVTVNGASEVARLFSQGRQVSDCAAANLATYTLLHNPETEGSCDLKSVKDRFQQTGSFADLFTSILTSPGFLTRDL